MRKKYTSRPYKRRPSKSWNKTAGNSVVPILICAASLGALGGVLSVYLPSDLGAVPKAIQNASTGRFKLCHIGGGTNCVVDGDTLWIDGEKIRVADIDAPETHPPRCPYEEELGNKATSRLHALVNEGNFTVAHYDGRDVDRYGRKLRVLERGGQSPGGILVQEGLARPWTGSRQPWC